MAMDAEITPELLKFVSENYRTLPMYESSTFDYLSKKRYSMQHNELLASRWRACIDTLRDRVRVPYKIIDPIDFHFYNQKIEFAATETPSRRPDFCMKMKLGPGTDRVGPLPLTSEPIYRPHFVSKKAVKKDKRAKIA